MMCILHKEEKMMKLRSKIFGKQKSEHNNPVEKGHERRHDYGLNSLNVLLATGDYGWSIPYKNVKRVILTNPKELKNKITLTGLISAWRGMGHAEWEAILADWLIMAVIYADERNLNEADITNMFNRDFYATESRVITKENVFKHLMKTFDIHEETEDYIKVRFRI